MSLTKFNARIGENILEVVSTIDELKRLKHFNHTVLVLGGSEKDDGDGGIYSWDAASTSQNNNLSVVQSYEGSTGRWIRLSDFLSSGTSSGINHTHTIANITNLQNILNGKIGETEINSAHFTFANDTLSLKTIQGGQIATDAITTTKIDDGNVTKAKIEDVANMKVLGNTSGSATAPQEVSILDQDDMSSNSATALATQQSIKAYVDGVLYNTPSTSTFLSATRASQSSSSDFNVSGYTLSGSGISQSSGTVTFSGAGVWLLEVHGGFDLSHSDAIWYAQIYINNSLSYEKNHGSSYTLHFGMARLINSGGSFTVRVRGDERSGNRSATFSNLAIQAVKLS